MNNGNKGLIIAGIAIPLIALPVLFFVVILSVYVHLQNMDFYFPLDPPRTISSTYGERAPISTYVPGYGTVTTSGFHKGTDFSAATGTPIYAANSGTITTARNLGVYGNCIVLTKENGDYSKYFHMDTILVAEGDVVFAGDLIGTVGSTGLSTGPHLHLEIWIDGMHIDPLSVLKERPAAESS